MKAMIINNGSQGNLDEVTATSADVRIGKISVDSEGETFEGEIEDIQEATIGTVDWTGENTPSTIYPGDAVAADILEGKTAWVNDEVVTGTMLDLSSHTDIEMSSTNNSKVITGANGYFGTNTDDVNRLMIRLKDEGYIKNHDTVVGLPQDEVAALVGLTPEKVLQGQMCLGINGTATNDATAADNQLLNGKTAYVNGSKITGTMPNRPSWTEYTGMWWDGTNPMSMAVTFPYGYYSSLGPEGNASIILNDIGQDKTVTPTKSQQNILADSGKVLHGVGIKPIPAEYITTTDANAEAGHILESNTAYVKGSKITGTMTHLSNRSTVKFSSSNLTPVVLGDNCYVDTNTDNTKRAMIRVNPGGYIAGGCVVGIDSTSMLGKLTNDATAAAGQILSGATAYVNGSKITGSMISRGSYTMSNGVNWDPTNKVVNLLMPLGAYVTPTTSTSGVAGAQARYVDKSVTPTTSSQIITADEGKVLHQVTVKAIDGSYCKVVTKSTPIKRDFSTPTANFTVELSGINSADKSKFLKFIILSSYSISNGTSEGSTKTDYSNTCVLYINSLSSAAYYTGLLNIGTAICDVSMAKGSTTINFHYRSHTSIVNNNYISLLGYGVQ